MYVGYALDRYELLLILEFVELAICESMLPPTLFLALASGLPIPFTWLKLDLGEDIPMLILILF